MLFTHLLLLYINSRYIMYDCSTVIDICGVYKPYNKPTVHSEVLQNTGTSIITILLRKAMRLLTLYVEYTIAKYSD
jgi:hypothetical protein